MMEPNEDRHLWFQIRKCCCWEKVQRSVFCRPFGEVEVYNLDGEAANLSVLPSSSYPRSVSPAVTARRLCEAQTDNDGVTFQITVIKLPDPALPSSSPYTHTHTEGTHKHCQSART